jgi:hypothetical protein
MKVDFSKQLLTIDDKPMDRSNIDKTPVDLAWVTVASLLAETEEGYDAKVRAFALAQRVRGGGELVISPEESTFIRDRINKAFKNVTVVARSIELLNG